jgi:hypothetical protein
MNNDDLITPVFFSICSIALGVYLIGHNMGYNRGKETTIKHCIEKQSECKLEYDYLKLQEKNK